MSGTGYNDSIGAGVQPGTVMRCQCYPRQLERQLGEDIPMHGPGSPGGGEAPLAFPCVNRFCMGLLYGRAGRLNAKNGGFRRGQSTCA